MRQCNWILLAGFLLATIILEPACSKQGSTDSDSAGQPAQGGSADPASSLTSGKIDGATVPQAPGAPMNYEKQAVTNIQELFNTNNAGAYWTRGADLTGVTVLQIFSDKQFLIVGSDKEHTLLVRLEQLHPEIKVGQKVDLYGVINPTGSDKSQWNVHPDTQNAIGEHSIFISAKTIRVASGQ